MIVYEGMGRSAFISPAGGVVPAVVTAQWPQTEGKKHKSYSLESLILQICINNFDCTRTYLDLESKPS